MSNDPPRPGPPMASAPAASSVGAAPVSSKPASSSTTAASGAGASAPKSAPRGRTSIFERVREAARKVPAVSPTSSAGGSTERAAVTAELTTTTPAPGNAALAPPPSHASYSHKPTQSPLQDTSLARKIGLPPNVPSKPSDAADEAAIDHALFSSPSAPEVAPRLAPPPLPSSSSAHSTPADAPSVKPTSAPRPATATYIPQTFKKIVSAPGKTAVKPSVSRSPASTALDTSRPSFELGDKSDTNASAVTQGAKHPALTIGSPSLHRSISGSAPRSDPQPLPKTKPTFRKIVRDVPHGPPLTPTASEPSTATSTPASLPRSPFPPIRPPNAVASADAATSTPPVSTGPYPANAVVAQPAVAPTLQAPSNNLSPHSSAGSTPALLIQQTSPSLGAGTPNASLLPSDQSAIVTDASPVAMASPSDLSQAGVTDANELETVHPAAALPSHQQSAVAVEADQSQTAAVVPSPSPALVSDIVEAPAARSSAASIAPVADPLTAPIQAAQLEVTQPPATSPSTGPVKKRVRAVLNDSDSDSAPGAPLLKTQGSASRSSPTRLTPPVAMQTTASPPGAVDDEDDVPLGAIIHQSSPPTSPKPPLQTPALVPVEHPSPSATLAQPAPISVAATAQSASLPPTPATATGAPKPAAEPQPTPTSPVKQEPFYVGSDVGSNDDDDIIFVAERPPGHKLIVPAKRVEPSTKFSVQPPPVSNSKPASKEEIAAPTAESGARASSRPPPRRATRLDSPPSSDPLNIHNGQPLTRSESPVVEKTPHSVSISPRKRRMTRASTSEVDEPAPSKRPRRAAAARGQQSAAADESHDGFEAEGDDTDDPMEDEVDEVEEDDIILRLHRGWCEKCEQPPADELLAKLEKKRKRGGRKKKATSSDEDVMSDGETIEQMGGWIECQRCCVASHFGCLSAEQRSNLLKQVSLKTGQKQDTVEIGETSSFVCGGCAKNATCFACGSAEMQEELGKTPNVPVEPLTEGVAPPPANIAQSVDDAHKMVVDTPIASAASVIPVTPAVAPSGAVQVPMDVDTPAAEFKTDGSNEGEKQPILFFRCFRCKRGVHYLHLVKPRGMEKASAIEVAAHHQDADWQCHDCLRWVFDVDKVIAWRPSPPTAVEDPLPPGVAADYRKQLPREYLVKWIQLGFRHIEWVPHQWLLANSKQRLRNFLHSGSDLAPFLSQLSAEAADEPAEDGSVAQLLGLGNGSETEGAAAPVPTGTAIFTAVGPPAANPFADSQIPTAWKTIDRVLTVWLKRPSKRSLAKKGRGGRRIYDRDIDDEDVLEIEPGLRPEDEDMVDIDEWRDITGLALDERAIKQVIWVYVKWQDLPYKLATYDTPPPTSDAAAYATFERAWRSYTQGLQTIVPILTKSEIAAREAKKKFTNIRSQPACIVGGTLMDFQLQGLNWLYSQWCKGTPCILADDMGLGKTVQIAALVGLLASKHYYPTLIVVPNSTISNWMREFDKWIPDVRVAPYNGEKESRAVIEEYELFHGDEAGGRIKGLKVHCVITTYEAVTHKSFNDVFRRVPRWEMLVADEGQRLKNDASKIVKALGTLNIAHRVLLTGTPLNNNLRELFNLMNFLDPANWSNLDQLTVEYETVNSDNLAALRERLKPYFLRRVKADVLKLPPKHEVIVPISMRSLQREVYKGLMMSNAELIKNLVGGIQQAGQKQSVTAKAMKATNLSNLMMQLRKACAHPYLNQEDIEDKTVGPEEMHKRLTDASAKLSFLKLLLPKLFQKGHRILLFSGFVIALDILSDWLDGEGIPFFRLDGNTPQDKRQKDIDAFNEPGAATNLFILSTRAGGVGINLATADTVVMFDADFNPHQDIQAIARAYRFGQTKKVIVFKLMIRNSVEEKILEKGKRKMVLDQLIIQDMAKEEDTDVGSLIAFGAKALFAEEEAAVKHYSSEDVDGIIQRAETAEDVSEADGGGGGGMKFDYAEIYDGSKDAAAEGEALPAADADEDFWDAIVKRATKEKLEREKAGRGARRAKKTTYAELYDSPPPPTGKPVKPDSQAGSLSSDPNVTMSSSSDDSDFEPSQHRRRSLSPTAADELEKAGQSDSTLPKAKQTKMPKVSKAARTAVPTTGQSTSERKGQSKFAKLEKALLKLAGQVQLDLVSLLRTIHATTTAPEKRRELWDLALNLVASHLEVYGLVSSVKLQPLVRRKSLAYSYLDALPYNGPSQAPAAAPVMTTSLSRSSAMVGPSKSPSVLPPPPPTRN